MDKDWQLIEGNPARRELRLGTKTIMGTDWPVDFVVEKRGDRFWGGYTRCNGMASPSELLGTLAAAQAEGERVKATGEWR